MTKRKSRRSQSNRLARYGLAGLIAMVLIAGIAYFILGLNRAPAPIDPTATDVAGTLARSDTAFNVSTRVGQLAPSFSLTDAQGKAYAFKPGDGQKYVLAFNMGFV